jgi:hypothetical protein
MPRCRPGNDRDGDEGRRVPSIRCPVGGFQVGDERLVEVVRRQPSLLRCLKGGAELCALRSGESFQRAGVASQREPGKEVL